MIVGTLIQPFLVNCSLLLNNTSPSVIFCIQNFKMAEVMSIGAQQSCTWKYFAADLAAAAIASVLVSPWVAAIDK